MKKLRCRASDLLQRDWEPFRRFFEQNEEPLIFFNAKTCEVVDVNQAACHLFGHNHDAMIDEGLDLFCDPNELDNLKGIILNAAPSEQAYVTTYFRRDGSKSVLRFRSSSIEMQEGRLICCSFRDIGDEIRRKEEGRFRQAQLIHANKMGALGMLVTSVAHEISNPNNFIMHNNQILAEIWKDVFPILREYYRENGDYYLGGIPLSEFEEVVPRLVYGILDGSERIGRIISDLRDFVRSDRARVDSSVDLAEVVSSAVALMRTEIGKHTNSFSHKCEEGLPPIRGSSQKLEQVVINLLMNALQALTDRDQPVGIRIGYDAAAGQVVLSISDKGSGIKELERSRIMEPFYSTKLDKGGTGLGLYISHSIIREHNGAISFESEPGSGTTVYVRFPVVAAAAGEGTQ